MTSSAHRHRIKLLLHWFTKGLWYPHALAGGWCPVCGSIYLYPGWQPPTEADWSRCSPWTLDAPWRELLPRTQGRPLWQVFAEEDRSKKA